MKSRLMDVMGDALGLVKKGNLSGATQRLREALARGAPERGGERADPAPPARRSIGESLGALRALRLAMPAQARARQRPSPEKLDPNFTARAWRGADGALSYRLYIPADTAKRDLAIVMMLHGCTQGPEDFALGTRMNALADEFGLIVAYPLQPLSANPSGCWNWFDKRHQTRGSGEPAKLAGLAQSLQAEFGVSRERTFVAGLSAGGAMAEVLGATYPDVFEAVGIHSGLPYKAAGDVASAFAAMKNGAASAPAPRPSSQYESRKIIFHGGADATVHPDNARRLVEQAKGDDPGFEPTQLDWQIEGGRVERTVARDSAGRALVESYLVEGGAHAWFGGDARGTYTQSVGLDASRVMVRFFLKH